MPFPLLKIDGSSPDAFIYLDGVPQTHFTSLHLELLPSIAGEPRGKVTATFLARVDVTDLPVVVQEA